MQQTKGKNEASQSSNLLTIILHFGPNRKCPARNLVGFVHRIPSRLVILQLGKLGNQHGGRDYSYLKVSSVLVTSCSISYLLHLSK